MFDSLVVNGCSYSEMYARGGGHVELARKLNVGRSSSIALGGSANSRIIRTTIKHSYQSSTPTFYVVGLTFLHRWELTVLPFDINREFEGCWINPQAHTWSTDSPLFSQFWTQGDTKTFVNLMSKSTVQDHAVIDHLEDLMYKCLSLAGDLEQRGHRVLFYNQVDPQILDNLDHPRLARFNNDRLFVHGLRWASIIWQHQQGEPSHEYEPGAQVPPEQYRHIQTGYHASLNNFLVDYIQQNKILQ